jgi:hypothetical protein
VPSVQLADELQQQHSLAMQDDDDDDDNLSLLLPLPVDEAISRDHQLADALPL